MSEPIDPARLDDPVYVYQAMQRGQIARLTPMHVGSLYGEEIELAMEAGVRKSLAKFQAEQDRVLARLGSHRRQMLALCFLQVSIAFAVVFNL